MYRNIRIVYISDWMINENYLSDQDPFLTAISQFEAETVFRQDYPEDYSEIDLLVLHPMSMGPEVFDAIGQSKLDNPAIKTVVISSAHGSDLFLKAIDVGVDKYLLKPLLPGAVQKVVERLMLQSIDAKQAQKAYQQINLMFGSISKTSLLVRVGENGKIEEINTLLSDLMGMETEEIIGKFWLRFVEKRFWIFLRTLVRARLQSGEIYRGIIEIVGKNGQRITVDSTIYAVLHKNNQIEEIVFIAHDVSEMNKAILISMKKLIDDDTSLAVLFDHRYEVMMANQRFLEKHGYDNCFDFFNSCRMTPWLEETSHGLEPIYKDNCSQKETLEYMIKKLRKGEIKGRIITLEPKGEKNYYSVHVSSMNNPLIQNEHYHVLYFVDVTEMEKHKEEKISDAKLMSVGRLAAAITHEINTPITYIKGNLELLKMECEDKIQDIQELFQPIDDGIERIESIVASMYEFSGTGKEKMEPCSVEMTLLQALKIIYNRSKHIVPIWVNGEAFQLGMQASLSSCLTMGMVSRLEQVWIIIINNALDEFEKGKIGYDKRAINITILCNNEEIVVKLEDNAGGIPQEILENIFDFAVGGEKKKSMGIGLNVAKAIIDKHGGKIRVYNEPQGAVFEISFKTYQESE